ncbi:hypothetical protein [Micromonospora sp. NPDC047527]|uniref:hypothetical protein n=1 Tax=Micromonospora sp. NPDC047527 TaxID=3155144 RepID=UPI0033D43D98
MIERGGGRTSGHTNWQLMDVNSMWACLQDHDTTNHWKQVAGWRKVCDLAQIHLGRLQEYRRGLAEAWPPETSAASGTYLAQLDELIDKVRHTHDAAAANYTALSAATQAIGTTRARLRKIHEEYAAKLQQKQAYEATAADPKAIMGNRATAPPVTDVELERLNAQARAMMFNLSGELQQAQATLQKPPPPPPRQSGKDISNSDAYGTASAPTIPPILPVPIPATTAKGNTPAKLASSSAGPAPTPTAPGLGPILGGTGIGPNPPSTTLPTPVSPPSTPSGPTLAYPPPPPAPKAIRGQGGWTGALNSNRPDQLSRSASADPLRGMPPGGLIGGTPTPPRTDASANSPRRVNPIGGVIGGGGAGTTPTGGAGSRPSGGRGFSGAHGLPPIGGAPGLGQPGLMGGTGRAGRRDGHTTEPNRWDPDNPWSTEQGVDPIVRPPEDDGPIDPGPAIGIGR